MVLFCKEYHIQPAKVIEILLILNHTTVPYSLNEVNKLIIQLLGLSAIAIYICVADIEYLQFDAGFFWDGPFWLHHNELLQFIQSKML